MGAFGNNCFGFGTSGGSGGGGGTSPIIPIQFIIGDVTTGAPAAGTTIYSNAALNGKILFIQKNGPGFLTQGITAGQYQPYSGGGFELQGGSVFSNDEVYTIFPYTP